MIDWNKPYGTICGELEGYPNARYAQDGKYFRINGEEVVNISGEEYTKTPGYEAVEEQPEEVEVPDDLDSMHWKTLKVKVEEAGGEWTNKTDAIEFLKNGDVS